MKVIGAGLGRTGTLSLKSALERLGLKSYHMKVVFETEGHFDAWRDFSIGKTDISPIIDLLAKEGFNATTDFPACIIHKELLAKYPNARVVLGARRSGDAWAKSILATIGRNKQVFGVAPFTWFTMLSEFLV